jgi:MSHA biogenesis protein MshQ
LLNIGIDNSFTRAFQGDIDEVRIFNGALSDSQVATIAAETHTCPVVLGPDHYEMALNSNSLTCLPSTVTVTACADTTSPCANAYTAASGSTATLTTSGATLGASTVTFNVSGVATTTLSYPTAADSTSVSVTLSGELIAATSANPRQCCPNGSSCTVTSSCSTIFKSAGFIFSSSNNGAAATIPAQVAGVGSGSYVLRAVQTNPSTMACQSALTGAQSVNFAYECTDPSTCYGANLMSVNGGTATTISRNNSGSHSSVTPVNLTFDASGNAPITFVYSDVGKVTLWASATVNSAVLTGSTSPTGGFLVKPYDLGVIPCAATVVGACTAAPSDPGLAGGGSAFATAGKAFKATITARAFGGLATPSFGSGSSNTTETVGLTVTRVAPTSAGAVDGALGGTTSSTRSNFASGILTVSDLTWSEVGVIMLTASNSTFFGSTTSTTGATGNVGRFIPDHFDTVVTGLLGCPSGLCTSPVATMAYSGQPFGVTVTAKNAGGNTTQNYQGSFAKLVTLSAVASNGGSAIATTSPGGTLSLNTIAASAFAAGVNPVTAASPVFTFATAPTAPTDVYIRAVDSDLVSSLRSPTSSSGEGGLEIVSGQLKIINNYGSELLSLPIHLVSQYWANATTRWVNSTTDNTTSFVVASPSATSAVSFSNFQKNLTTVTVSGSPVTITLAAGRGSFTLAAPGAGHNGSFDLSIPSVSCSTSPMPLGCYLPSSTGTAGISRSVFGIYKSPLIYRRENY